MDDIDEKRMSFGEHLEELRRRVLYALMGPVVGFIVCYVFFHNQIFDLIVNPPTPRLYLFGRDLLSIQPISRELTSSAPYSVFASYMLTSLVAGIIVSSPWVIYHIWKFVASGLYPNERRHVRVYGSISVLLFAAGVLFFYFLVYPMSLDFLYGFAEAFNDWQKDHGHSNVLISTDTLIEQSVNFAMLLALVFGIMFEIPLVVLFLGRTGLVEPGTFARYRKHVVLTIVIVAAIVTPPDVFSQIALALPMWLLYEAGVLMVRLGHRRREAAA